MGHREAAKLKRSWRTAGLGLVRAHERPLAKMKPLEPWKLQNQRNPGERLSFSIMWPVWSPSIEARRPLMKVKQHKKPRILRCRNTGVTKDSSR